MENICIIKKLGNVVNDDKYPKVGEIIVNVKTATTKIVRIEGSQGSITLVGEGTMTRSDGQSGKTFGFGSNNITIPAGEYKLLITNKYDITYFRVPFVDLNSVSYMINATNNTLEYCKGDISNFKNHNTLGTFIISGNDVYGNLDVVASKFVTACYLDISNTAIKGQVSSLGNITNGTVYLTNCIGINGSIESLVSVLTSKLASGRIGFRIYGTSITFGGTIPALHGGNSFLVWESANVFWYQEGTDAQIADTSTNVHIYAKGVSASQISTWESQGNTVHVIS